MSVTAPIAAFQSRYRAASHFRCSLRGVWQNSILSFQSRYRAASHFRWDIHRQFINDAIPSFNLVIKRLLISGVHPVPTTTPACPVSISLSSGFSFQVASSDDANPLSSIRFQSRYRAASHFRRVFCHCSRYTFRVSISLSSGFSFQEKRHYGMGVNPSCFNLVIERLLISGLNREVDSYFSTIFCFNLVIERLLISGADGKVYYTQASEFQSRYRAASHFR